MAALIKNFANTYDIVIIDTLLLNVAADAAAIVGKWLMVFYCNSTSLVDS